MVGPGINKMISEIGRWISMAMMLFNICNQSPETRQACMSDWDVWLYPELQRAWDIRTGKETPYQEEDEKLRERQTDTN